jgi:hypothetical protein
LPSSPRLAHRVHQAVVAESGKSEPAAIELDPMGSHHSLLAWRQCDVRRSVILPALIDSEADELGTFFAKSRVSVAVQQGSHLRRARKWECGEIVAHGELLFAIAVSWSEQQWLVA